MKEFETVFILHPQVDEAGIEQQIEEVKKTIEAGSGEVTGVYKWGRRKLAYPIRKTNEGFYTLIRFRSGPEVLRELDRRFKLNESVLRHLTVHSCGEPHPPEHRGRERRSERGRFRRGGRGPGGPGEAAEALKKKPAEGEPEPPAPATAEPPPPAGEQAAPEATPAGDAPAATEEARPDAQGTA